MTRQIHRGEVELRVSMVLFSGELHPFEGQGVVLRYAAPNAIERRKPVLCFGVSRLCELANDRCRAVKLSRTNRLINCIHNGGFVASSLRERRAASRNQCSKRCRGKDQAAR